MFAIYRRWAKKVFNAVEENVATFFKHNENIAPIDIAAIITSKKKKEGDMFREGINVVELDDETEDLYDVIYEHKPDAVFFVGWSFPVSPEVLRATKCFCIHPSPLPLFKGGSPIQNQIIRGQKKSAVTLFQMSEEIDGGPIVGQKELSLEGTLDDIFRRIIEISTQQIMTTIRLFQSWSDGYVKPQKGKGSIYKRRKPADSEITKAELAEGSAEYLYNKIRCIMPSDYADYPNAYIVCADGKRLYLTGAKLDE